MKQPNRNNATYEKAFYEVFKSAQLSGSYVIYYDIDFSKEELEDFSAKLIKHNREELNHTININMLRKFMLENFGFNTNEEIKKFPYRARIKMANTKTKPNMVLSVDIASKDALECYVLLAGYTLKKDFNFTKAQFMAWYNKLVEFCRLYSDGLTDKHVLEYFKMECNLTIEETD